MARLTEIHCQQERKRERAHGGKEARSDAIRNGKYPVVLSKPRVLVGLYQIISDS
jgi:hypothetical protein